jgi:iron complex transport system ATP-binding protein
VSAVLLAARGLSVEVGGKTVCRGLGLELRPGESWAVLGLNGAGKTTLLLTLAGLRPPAAGEISICERPLSSWSARQLAQLRGLMPQDTVDAFPLTVLEAVLAGRYPHQQGWGRDGPEDLCIARGALERVGLADLAQRDCATLSGGERRGVALAALLAQQPDLYLLDEPTHHLDPRHQIALLDLLAEEWRAGKAALMSLHDPNLAARYCSHVLMLFGDGHAEQGPSEDLLRAETLGALYRHPMRCIRDGAGRCFLPA